MAHSMTYQPDEHPQISPADLTRAAERAERVLAEAKRQGASAAEVHLGQGQGLSVNVRLGEVETLEFHHSRELSVTVYSGKRKGVATSTDDSDAAIKATVQAAYAIAREAEADEFAGLAEAELLARDLPQLDIYHPWALTADDAIVQARACEAAGLDTAGIVNSEGASLSTSVGLGWYANSQGFSAGNCSSSHQRSCVLIAKDEAGMQRDYWYDSHCRAERLADADRVGQEAARRTLARLGGRKPVTGSYPVLFAPEVAVGLIGHFIGAISGGNLYRKNSFLCDALGEQVFPDWVSIGERPHLPGEPGSSAFDRDGLATREQQFIRDGRLQGYALGLYASRQLKLSPTGNGSGVHNLYISDSGKTQAQLLAEMGTGVLVTELMGSAINAVTGDYSRGASGFWVEGGVITHALEEFTLAGNLRDIFANLQAAGTDVDRRRRIQCGSLLLAPMKVAG